ncbi:hypothetical protein C8Q74DRAFT_1362267 [Fomes fomentarius]|nr:hypothetical protein C8Q74DRAFT_1362267 [Fomes fomentarius]
MSADSLSPALHNLRATLAERRPFCSGTLELPVDFELYYGKKTARYVNLCIRQRKAQTRSEPSKNVVHAGLLSQDRAHRRISAELYKLAYIYRA